MSLKYKTGLIIAVIFIVFGAGEYTIQQRIILPKFNALEIRAAMRDTQRVVKSIDRELHHLNLLCFDWAAWDDTFDFIDSRSDDYIRANLIDTTFTGNRLNLISFYDIHGNRVWGEFYDLEADQKAPLGGFTADRLPDAVPLLDFSRQKKDLPDIFITGIVSTGKGPMLIASRPVIRSSYEGPVKGTVIMGRLLTGDMMEILKKQTEVEFSTHWLKTGRLPPKQRDRIEKIQQNGGYITENRRPDQLSVSTVLNDLHGMPVILLETAFTKAVTKEGRAASGYALFTFTLLALVILGIGLLLLQIFILRPLVALDIHSAKIADTGIYLDPPGLMQKDEIGSLSRSVAQMTNSLFKMKSKLQSVIDSMPSGLLCIDHHGTVTLANLTATDYSTVPGPRITGRKLWEAIPWFGNLKSTVLSTVERGDITSFRRHKLIFNQKESYFDIIVYPIRLQDIDEAVIIIQNVTHSVLLERAAVKSEKMMSLGRLATGMAHEINNPLSGIMQNIQLMENRLTRSLPANEKAAAEAGTTVASVKAYMESRGILKALTHIHQSSGNAARIVNSMLSFAREAPQEKSAHKPGDLIDSALEMVYNDPSLKNECDFRKIEIIRQIDDHSVSVLCEQNQILQVFLNILKNAAEAIHEGSPVRTDPPRITIRFAPVAGMGQFEIQDNGPGMDDGVRQKIFEPFFTTKPVDTGTGLGLSLCYYIVVTDHGGEIEVKSEESTGTTILFRLPLAG